MFVRHDSIIKLSIINAILFNKNMLLLFKMYTWNEILRKNVQNTSFIFSNRSLKQNNFNAYVIH